MTKKKKSILSDQRFIVLLVIIVLCAIFSGLSKEFRQYTTILSMLDFSYYDLLMAIGVTFPLITGGVDLSIGTGMVAYALIAGTLIRNNNCPVALAMIICIVLGIAVGALNGVLIGVMNLPPFLATLCTCMITRGAGSLCSATPWMVPQHLQGNRWYRKKCFTLSARFPVDDHSGSSYGVHPEPHQIRSLHNCNRFQQRGSSPFWNQYKVLSRNGIRCLRSVYRSCSNRIRSSNTYCTAWYWCRT